MTLIQLDLTDNTDKFVRHWAVEHKMTKTEAVNDILCEFIINWEQGRVFLHTPTGPFNKFGDDLYKLKPQKFEDFQKQHGRRN